MKHRHWLAALAALALGAAPAAAQEREVEGISIIGNQELPKNLFIVPWQPAELNAGLPAPVSGLPVEAAAPLDPVVFRRELEAYRAAREGTTTR